MVNSLSARELLCAHLTDIPQSRYALCLQLGWAASQLEDTLAELSEWGVPVCIDESGYALEAGTPAPRLVNPKGQFGKDLRYLGTIDSTQDELRRHGSHGSVVVAEQQTAGRGRRGRIWNTQQRSLAMSLRLHGEQSAVLPLAIGVALRQTVADFGVPCALKWPNDLLDLNRKKLAGILIETEKIKNERITIIGIGLNVKDAPQGASAIGDFLTVSRASLLEMLLLNMEEVITYSDAQITEEWRKNNNTLGHPIQTPYGTAKAIDITEEGLLIETSDSSVILLRSGDIELVHEWKES